MVSAKWKFCSCFDSSQCCCFVCSSDSCAVEGIFLDERFEMLWSFSVFTSINVFLLKTLIALVYQDCLFLEVSTCLCTPGVILSLLEPAGCGDGQLAYIAVWGQWSWQSAGASQCIPRHALFAASLAWCTSFAQSCTFMYRNVHSHFLYMLLPFSVCFSHLSWTALLTPT